MQWLPELKSHLGDGTSLVLVGTKLDLLSGKTERSDMPGEDNWQMDPIKFAEVPSRESAHPKLSNIAMM
jgi:hypothetical protein